MTKSIWIYWKFVKLVYTSIFRKVTESHKKMQTKIFYRTTKFKIFNKISNKSTQTLSLMTKYLLITMDIQIFVINMKDFLVINDMLYVGLFIIL
jgi:hypothetical protein